VVEALALGTPVVGFRRGCLPELVEHGRTGLPVDPGDEDAFAAALDAAGLLDPGSAAARPPAASPRPGWPGGTCGSTTRCSSAAAAHPSP
jgi:glycosyltransferase involved in cell wall biosynthesis